MTEIYFLIVLEARSQKSKCQPGQAPFEVSRTGACLTSPASGDPRHSLVHGGIMPILFPSSHDPLLYVHLCIASPLLIRTLVIGVRAHPALA